VEYKCDQTFNLGPLLVDNVVNVVYLSTGLKRTPTVAPMYGEVEKEAHEGEVLANDQVS
jgi:hypothetical protein